MKAWFPGLAMALTLLATAGMAGAYDVDGPNAARLRELYQQIETLKAAGQYDADLWAEFQRLSSRHPSGSRVLLQGGDDVASAVPLPVPPTTVSGTTVGYANDYDEVCPFGGSIAPDVVYVFVPAADATLMLDLCASFYDTKLYVYANAAGNVVACNDDDCGVQSRLQMDFFAGNTYYIVVDGYEGDAGDYELTVGPLPPWICTLDADGVFPGPGSSFIFRQTTDENDTPPLYGGPYDNPSECGPSQSGFEIYSWYNQDYGWAHYWPDWNTAGLNILSVQVKICAYDVDEHSCLIENPGNPEACELDNIFVDGELQNPTYLSGDDGVDRQTVFDVAPARLLDDGYLNMWIDIDVWHTQCTWATTLYHSQLIVTYIAGGNTPPFQPEAVGMECVDENTVLCATVTGPDPADPDGDAVTHTYRWFVANAFTGYGFVDDELNPLHPFNHTGPCIPADHSDIGDLWRAMIFAVDEHGVQSLQPTFVDFPLITEVCEFVDDCGGPLCVDQAPVGWATAPGTLADLVVQVLDDQSIALHWTPVPGADFYHVLTAGSASTHWEDLGSTVEAGYVVPAADVLAAGGLRYFAVEPKQAVTVYTETDLACWPMDEGVGPLVEDFGQDNDGTIVGADWALAPSNHWGLHFEYGDYVSVANDVEFYGQPLQVDACVSIAEYPTIQTGAFYIFSCHRYATWFRGFGLRIDVGGRLLCEVWDQDLGNWRTLWAPPSLIVPLNEPFHVTAVINGRDSMLLLNSNVIAAGRQDYHSLTNGFRMTIGAHNYNDGRYQYHMRGDIHWLKVSQL